MTQLPVDPWAQSKEALAETLETDPHRGLSDTVAAERLATYGENLFESADAHHPLQIFFRQFSSPLIILLCVAVVITALLNEWFDMTIIVFAILVNAILGFIQEAKAEKAITDLRSYITERTRVIRDGQEREIDPRLLVPGDLIHVKNGARITADGRIVHETNFTTDESVLTGESLPVEKDIVPLLATTDLSERTNMVFAGTLNIDGAAQILITATGYQTEIGKLAQLVDETESEKTPLQVALGRLTWAILAVTSVAVFAMFFAGIYRGIELFDMLVISIAVLVGSVPESLPIGLTAILAIGVERIAKKKGIMRSLTAAETLGSTTLIITDKTGTLTQANMRLVDIDTRDELLKANFTPSDHKGIFDRKQTELLTLARCASDVIIENPEDDLTEWNIIGSDLESNIARSAARHGILQTAADRTEIQTRIPFSSKYKFSVTKIPSHYLPKDLSQFADPHIVMGAPDILLSRAHMMHDEYEQIRQAINAHSENGRRILGLALLTPAQPDTPLTVEEVDNITFLGVLSFSDPIRPEVPEAIKRIQAHDLRVVMATGDLPGTALAIAHEIGLAADTANVLTGTQLRQFSDEDLLATLDHVSVFARVTPEDKLRITKLYQRLGEVVAMTGDGVNDAPSLKAANIGIAVGSGTDVAKGVADLVLLDNNFHTIVATIEEGKQILSNIKKVFVYLVSNSLDELVMIGGSIIVGVALPFTAVQIIWVNLFTGSLPAIAFAFDRQRLRESRKESKEYFDTRTVFLTLFIGIVTSLLLFLFYILLLKTGTGEDLARSIVFLSFGTYVLFISFSFIDLTRPIFHYSLLKNHMLLVGVGIGLLVMVLTFALAPLRELLEVTAVPLPWLFAVVGWIILNIAIVEVAKWLANRYVAHRVDEPTKIA